MTAPAPGVMAFHRGAPIELLYLIHDGPNGQLWCVRPLFVPGPERDVVIAPSDVLTPLHTKQK